MHFDIESLLELTEFCRPMFSGLDAMSEAVYDDPPTEFFGDKEEEIKKYCPLPADAMAFFVCSTDVDGELEDGLDFNECMEYVSLWLWDKDKNYYVVEDNLYDAMSELADEFIEEEQKVDASLLMNLPEKCVYLKNPGCIPNLNTEGFMVRMNYDLSSGKKQLLIQEVAPDSIADIYQIEDMEDDIGTNDTLCHVINIGDDGMIPSWRTMIQDVDCTVENIEDPETEEDEDMAELVKIKGKELMTIILILGYAASKEARIKTVNSDIYVKEAHGMVLEERKIEVKGKYIY